MHVHCILYGTYIIPLNLIDGMYERMYVFMQMYQNEHAHAKCQQYSKSGPDQITQFNNTIHSCTLVHFG